MFQLAKREKSRIAVDMTRIEGNTATVSDQLNLIQNHLFNVNEKMSKIMIELKLGKQELGEWLRVQQEKDEDNNALQKYTKIDAEKIKNLTLKIERLMIESNKKKNLLAQEVRPFDTLIHSSMNCWFGRFKIHSSAIFVEIYCNGVSWCGA